MKYLIVIIFIIVSKSVLAQQYIEIVGTTNVFEDGVIISITSQYPYRTIQNYPGITDSSLVKNKRFQLSINMTTAEFFTLKIKKKNGEEITNQIFLQPANTQLVLNDSTLKYVIVNNNIAATENISFLKALKVVETPTILENLWSKYDLVRKSNSKQAMYLLDTIQKIENTLRKKESVISINWIKEHPASYLNTFIIYYFLRPQLSETTISKMFYRLPEAVRKNSWGKELNYLFNFLVAGKQPPDFIQTDTTGKEVSLSDFKGKYVLINFWSSWCKPCREEHPALRIIYDRFKINQFIILSISIDENRDAWIKAINKDSLSWPQLSDLNGWRNKIAKAYGVNAIPTNFFLSPDGKIIAKNVSMPTLSKILKDSLIER